MVSGCFLFLHLVEPQRCSMGCVYTNTWVTKLNDLLYYMFVSGSG